MNEYIDFHSWYGEITWTGSTDLDPALIVVSTDRVVKPWDGTATLSGKGDLTAAGITGVSVDAIYSRKFDTDTLKTRKVYISVNELYTTNSYGSVAGRYHNIATEADYGRIPWLMKANTDYYVHIYYTEGGANKTYSHPFKTPDYPTTVAQADNLFPSTNWLAGSSSVPTEPHFFNIEGAPSPIEIKRDIADASAGGSSFEPFIYSRGTYYLTGPNGGQTITFTHERYDTAGACITGSSCGTGLGTVVALLTFSDHSSAYERVHNIPSGTFGVVDLVLFTTNASAQAVNKDGNYSISWGSAARSIDMKSITE